MQDTLTPHSHLDELSLPMNTPPLSMAPQANHRPIRHAGQSSTGSLRVILSALLIVTTMSMALGCKSTPEVRHYQLNLVESQSNLSGASSGKTSNASATTGKVLGVDMLRAETAYDDMRIVYRKSPYRVDYYHYHRWSAPPSLMLTDVLRDGLSQTGAFGRVTNGYGRDVDAVLRGRVVAIEEVDKSETEWEARVVLDLELEQVTTGEVLWSRTLSQSETVEERNPEGVTIAASKAMGKIIVEMLPELVTAMESSPSGTAFTTQTP